MFIEGREIGNEYMRTEFRIFIFPVGILPKARTRTTWGRGLPVNLRSLSGAQVLTVELKAPRMEFEICPPLPFLSVEALLTTKR